MHGASRPDTRRVLWRCPTCVRRGPAGRNALRFLRCVACLVPTRVAAARNSSGSFGRNGNGGAAPRRVRLATHAICCAPGSFRQNSCGTIRISRLGSFGQNDILLWLSELFWLSEPRVRLANIACIGVRTVGWRACGSQARAAHSDASRPPGLDLRRREPACDRETLAARIGACNGSRQGGDLLRAGGIKAGGPAQAVPDRVAGGARLAFGRLRATAVAPIGAARFTPCCADHAVSPIWPLFTVCSTTAVSGMQAKKLQFASPDRAVMPPLTRHKGRFSSLVQPASLPAELLTHMRVTFIQKIRLDGFCVVRPRLGRLGAPATECAHRRKRIGLLSNLALTLRKGDACVALHPPPAC